MRVKHLSVRVPYKIMLDFILLTSLEQINILVC